MFSEFLLLFYFSLNFNNLTEGAPLFSLAQGHYGSLTLDLLFGVKIVPVEFSLPLSLLSLMCLPALGQ